MPPMKREISLAHVSGKWAFDDTQDVDEDVVEVMEKNDSGEYVGRKSALEDVFPANGSDPHAIIFTSTSAVDTWWNQCPPPGFKSLPAEFRPVVSIDINGNFGCYYHRDLEGNIIAHDSWSCFKVKEVAKRRDTFTIRYRWTQFTLFVRHNWETSSQLVLFLNVPKDLKAQFQSMLPQAHRRDPYKWHAVFLNQMKEIYDQAIWDLRGLVWELEAYQKEIVSFQPKFILLHDIARHISHSNEVLSVAADTVDCILYDQKELESQLPRRIQPWDFREVHKQLFMGSKKLHAVKLRCISLSERLQNEINLAYNIVAQRNAEVSVQMSKNALSDNTMMKTVAFVSLIYLPGTFVSGIFGMNFFDFNPQDGLMDNTGRSAWIVSEKFWLYWLITVILTVLTMIVWALWNYRRVVSAIFSWKIQHAGDVEREKYKV